MPRPHLRPALPLLAAAAVLALLIIWLRRGDPGPPELDASQLTLRPGLSALAPAPDWAALERYQGTIPRAVFLDQLRRVYSEGDAWRTSVEVYGEHAEIHAGGDTRWRLRFAGPGATRTPDRYWRGAAELPAADDLAARPLEGLHVAIDPGHIGGRWAKMEERWYQIEEGGVEVKEGELTLATARVLEGKLAELGAEVSLVRGGLEPVTRLRPPDFEALATEILKRRGEAPGGEALRKEMEILFYRRHEIRRRAWLVNERLRPDLVLCLHYNASSWGDPENPRLGSRNDLHLLINGTYSAGEFRLEDNRFHLFTRLLQRTHDEELPLALAVAGAMAEETGLPPYIYTTPNAQRASDGDYVWARNLLANRIYHCPVLFLEPYIMNNREVYARVAAGDYEGRREVAGEMRKSLVREYADGVAEGLRRYYREVRQKAAREPSSNTP